MSAARATSSQSRRAASLIQRSRTFKRPQMYLFDPFCIDAARRVLTRGGQRVPVTARAFDVLLALVERAGQTVDKDELLRIVWSDAVVEEANLSQQIFTLRKLLGQTE